MSSSVTKTNPRHERIASMLEAIEDGQSLAQLAEVHGITPQAISSFLLSNVPEQYKALQERGLIQRIVDADTTLEGASSHLDVARAREVCRFTRWDAERRLPHMFATRSEISGPGGGPIALTSFERAQRFAFLKREAIDVEPDAVQHEERSLTELSPENQGESRE
jgi:uncharacterized protein (DUF2249 family)